MKIDDRESESLKKALRDLGFTIEVTRLTIGDIVFGDICIEHKTLEDAVSSAQDGRLWTQLRNMKGYKYPLVMLSGVLMPGYKYTVSHYNFAKRAVEYFTIDHDWLKPRLFGTIATIYASYQMTVLGPYSTIEDMAKVIASIHDRIGIVGQGERPVPPKPDPNYEDIWEDIITRTPSVGLKAAKYIMKVQDWRSKLLQAKSLDDLKDRFPYLRSNQYEWLKRVFIDDSPKINSIAIDPCSC